jgi:hypothetical protein
LTGEPKTRMQRRAALLSAVAAGITALIFAWAIIASSDEATWLIAISLPPIASSLLATVQYRRSWHPVAGKAAVAIYWVFLLVYWIEGGIVFLPGALLQTAALFITRPKRPHATSERVHVFLHEDGDWWAECLICQAWVSTSNATRRAAEQSFGRHLQNDHGTDATSE